MKPVINNQKSGVYDYDVNGKTIAIIDKDSSEGTIIILTQGKKYVQRFFSNETDFEMVETCKLMKKLGVKSL